MAEWQTLLINPAVRLAVLFIVLPAARLSEATEATWPEIHLPVRLWKVPGRRMKARRGHEVPLSWRRPRLEHQLLGLPNLDFTFDRARSPARRPDRTDP